jgi:hypothetical protein
MTDRLKVAVLEAHESMVSATRVRGQAMADFLRARGHHVDIIAPTAAERHAADAERLGLASRLLRKAGLTGQPRHPWIALADQIEPRLRAAAYDVVIARAQDVGAVIVRRPARVCVYDMANIGFLEQYHTWGPDLDAVETTWRLERAMLEAADQILSPHPLLTGYFLSHFPGADIFARKTVTVRLGADPAPRVASYAPNPRIVYAGSYYYIQDPWLLAELSRSSRAPIDCYGFKDPNRVFLPAPLNYKGLSPDTGFLADYQLGLITVSRDRLRQFSPATKFPYYFVNGLPVLFPEWMREGFEYPDCAIPYREESFNDQVAWACEQTRWTSMHEAALERGRSMTWDVVLTPLAGLLER